MATIKEDFVSFETAILLKEKGFDVPCLAHWFIGTERNFSVSSTPCNWNEIKTDLDWLSCPTLQMAMKWLREVHNLVICAEIGNENDKCNTDYSNPDRWYWFFAITNEKGVAIDTEGDYILNEYSSYEETCEAAIKYCLENII